jgi:uncharacterized membrane protein YhaH (DUF805 family)
MATEFDSSILQQYADHLYRQAKWIVFSMAVKYGLAVFLVAFGMAAAIGSQRHVDAGTENSWLTFVAILTLVGMLIGVDSGRRKAFNLKLQAQELLCQRQIELNTRPARQN